MSTSMPDPTIVTYTGAPVQPPPSEFSFVSDRSTRFSADTLLHGAAALSGVTVLLMLASLLVVLVIPAMPSIRQFGLRFLTTSEWRPNPREVQKRDAKGHIVYDQDNEPVVETLPPQFGALPVIYGTVVSSALALLFAVPISLGAAMFLVRIAPRAMVAPVSFLIEFLAAIPSIAFGIWGLFALAPFLQAHVEPGLRATVGRLPGMMWLFNEKVLVNGQWKWEPIPLTGRDMFSGGIVLAVMVLPIITAISRDVLRQVPRNQVEGTVALGATWWQSSKEMLKFSRAGLFGAIMLGLARAAGETMAVTMVIGNNSQIKSSIFAPAQTMSSLLANEFVEAAEMQRAALCEVALILLIMSLLFNIVARYLVVGKGDSRASLGQ